MNMKLVKVLKEVCKTEEDFVKLGCAIFDATRREIINVIGELMKELKDTKGEYETNDTFQTFTKRTLKEIWWKKDV